MRPRCCCVVLVGLLFAFVYPTRTFLDQRNDTNVARAQLEVLQHARTHDSRTRRRSCSSDAEIERAGPRAVRAGEAGGDVRS